MVATRPRSPARRSVQLFLASRWTSPTILLLSRMQRRRTETFFRSTSTRVLSPRSIKIPASSWVTGLAYNSADGNIYFTQASTTGGPPNLYKIPSNPGSTLSSATLVASSIEGSSAAQITFNQTGDEAYVRGITSGGTTINQVDLATGAVSTVVSPSGQTGLSVIFAPGTTPTADLSVTVNDGVTSVAPGNIDTYTITVTNNGPDTVTKISPCLMRSLRLFRTRSSVPRRRGVMTPAMDFGAGSAWRAARV